MTNNTQQKKTKNSKLIRKPKQARSIKTKEKILKTALNLFCKKGFYKTTTNEIAKEASIPIGSLYSYFKNKEMILLEILDYYNQIFIEKLSLLNSLETIHILKTSKRLWIFRIIETLIELHKETKELSIELHSLYHSMPEVAIIQENHDITITQQITKELITIKDELKITDIEGASIVINDLISSLVDRIVFTNPSIDRERIINQGVELIYKYLFL